MKKLGKIRLAVVSATAALFALSMSGVALATCSDTTDPTNCAADDLLVTTKGWITGHGIPLLLGLFVIGLIVALLIKFGKRGTKAA